MQTETLHEVPVYLTEVDADRLTVLHRFVRRPIEGQNLKDLEDKIARAELLESEAIPPDVITMNSSFRLTDLGSEEQGVYTLVFPSKTDARKSQISVLGTLGTAVLGARVGQTIEYRSSAGWRKCRIDAILYQPEAAGDYSA